MADISEEERRQLADKARKLAEELRKKGADPKTLDKVDRTLKEIRDQQKKTDN